MLRVLAVLLVLLLSDPAAAVAQIKVSTEKHGPVALGDSPDRAVVIEATYDEATDAPKESWRRTLTRLRFRTRGGRFLYQETLWTRLFAGEGFDGANHLESVHELRGKDGRFLLLTFDAVPSAPSTGSTLAVYGFDRQGRFTPFRPDIGHRAVGVMNPVDPSGRVFHLREGRYLDVNEYTGSFDLILPWVINEETRSVSIVSACGRVEVRPETPPEGTVMLHRQAVPTPPGKARESTHLNPFKEVKVTPASKIKFLEGCRRKSDNPLGYDWWIRVVIDGEEGWVSHWDTPKIGLPHFD